MWGKILQFAPGAAFYVFALAAQTSGFTSLPLALVLAGIGTVLLLIPGCYQAYRWRRRGTGQSLVSESIPIAISEVQREAFWNYAGFFPNNNPDDAQVIVFRPTTIANLSLTHSVALDLTLRLVGDKVNIRLEAGLLDSWGRVFGKDDDSARAVAKLDIDSPGFFRNPIKLAPQQVERRKLAFLINHRWDELTTSMHCLTHTLEVTDHISGKTIAIQLPGEYRAKLGKEHEPTRFLLL